MTNIEKIKVKNLDSVDFCTIALTTSEEYTKITSGTHIKTKELVKETNQPIKDFIIKDI